jgi:hypothetical protein
MSGCWKMHKKTLGRTVTMASMLAFTVSAGLFLLHKKTEAAASAATCADPNALLNSAFVFVKPHANTVPTQELVRKTLISKGITIVAEGDISAEEIDQKKLIDQHYYAIGTSIAPSGSLKYFRLQI